MTISATSQGLRPGVCTSSNRPANPYDGMMIYETDTNLVRIWNGTAWKTLAYSDYSSGSVIQVSSTSKTDPFSTSSTSFVDVTGLSVSITPTSTSSKILVLGYVHTSVSGDIAFNARLMRDSTAIFVGDTAGSRPRVTFFNGPTNLPVLGSPFSPIFLDSPATTSSTTYKVQVFTNTGTIYVNRSGSDRDTSAYDGRTASSITVMEIAG